MDPVTRLVLIRRLRRLRFEGPFSGSKHQFMVSDGRRLILPNPHVKDIGPGLLARILREARVSEAEWEATR